MQCLQERSLYWTWDTGERSRGAPHRRPSGACVRRMLRCKLACTLLPSSSLDSRLASGAFAAAKAEGRDRSMGDRRPLNCRERSIGCAHLPCCTRLRRMILEKARTVQITIRDTKDCFYLDEVPPSRVTKQVIEPRTTQSWLEHLDDENWYLIDTDESWITQDFLKNACLHRVRL